MNTSNLAQAPAANPSFLALLESFARHSGLGQPSDALGLELEAGAYTARVLPDGSNDEQLVVEVDLGSAHGAPAAALALLHRVNHVARFRHGWWVSLDMDDQIVLHTSRSIAQTDAGALENLLTAGLERAAALDGLWKKALQVSAGSGGLSADAIDLMNPTTLRA